MLETTAATAAAEAGSSSLASGGADVDITEAPSTPPPNPNALNLTVHIHSEDEDARARAEATPLKLDVVATDKLSVALDQICRAWDMPRDKVRLWDYYNMNRYSLIVDEEKTFDESKIYPGQDMLLEHQQASGSWTFDADDAAGSSSTATGSSSTRIVGPTAAEEDAVMNATTPPLVGVVGLSNLGNTCFMNSMLQSLSNLKHLRRYFLVGDHVADLNPDNPLGAKGEVAEAFGSLLKKLWANQGTVVSPRGFKQKMGQHAPQFVGYAQHDSQELLNFLLDKLHEDLNRVPNPKPYAPRPTQRHLTPPHATPRHLMPRHATPRHHHTHASRGARLSSLVAPPAAGADSSRTLKPTASPMPRWRPRSFGATGCATTRALPTCSRASSARRSCAPSQATSR